jgi:hypothetical protein
MLLLPFVGHLLGLENLWWGHLGSGGIEVCFVVGQGKPQVSLNIIFWNTLARHVEKPQIVSSIPRST